MNDARYVMGIDGGASKTVAVVADEEGREIGRGVAGPSNNLVIGMERARQEVARAIQMAMERAGLEGVRLAAVCAGLSAVSSTEPGASWQEVLPGIVAAEQYLVEHDAIVALVGALGRPYGIVVIAGTGSVAVGVDASGRRARAGGWGRLFGDEGSGYDVGRRAVVAMLRAHDGRGPQTALSQAVLSQMGLARPEDLIAQGYAQSVDRQEVAALAPLVMEAARRGDAEAQRILAEAGRELGLAALAVVRRLAAWEAEIPVALMGGMGQVESELAEAFGRTLAAEDARVRLVRTQHEPVRGAVLLALQHVRRGAA